MTFEEFLIWKPEVGFYELYNGSVVAMQSVGEHEEIIGFINREITVEFDRLSLPYIIPKQVLVKIIDQDSAYSPDVLVINQENLDSEPL